MGDREMESLDENILDIVPTLCCFFLMFMELLIISTWDVSVFSTSESIIQM
jgi:hypothetical protein